MVVLLCSQSIYKLLLIIIKVTFIYRTSVLQDCVRVIHTINQLFRFSGVSIKNILYTVQVQHMAWTLFVRNVEFYINSH